MRPSAHGREGEEQGNKWLGLREKMTSKGKKERPVCANWRTVAQKKKKKKNSLDLKGSEGQGVRGGGFQEKPLDLKGNPRP